MMRTFLNMTGGISRSTNRVELSIMDLSDTTYWIFGTTEWSVNDVLPEMEGINLTDKLIITINGQFISDDYYILETNSVGITVKFIKSALPYALDSEDSIILKGDIKRHA